MRSSTFVEVFACKHTGIICCVYAMRLLNRYVLCKCVRCAIVASCQPADPFKGRTDGLNRFEAEPAFVSEAEGVA